MIFFYFLVSPEWLKKLLKLFKKSNKIIMLLTSKEKKDKKINKNKDNIRGNFMLKGEKIVRYQGGFIKRTKKKWIWYSNMVR
jgi:hypothetical protein